MSNDATFADFLRRIRAGDAQAAVELVRQYEPLIRVEVRLRLSDPRLRRLFDSMDICQSVLLSFFVRAAAGQYDLDQPGQLLKLLVAMAHNKVAFQARKQRAQRRDYRRVEALSAAEWETAAVDPGPSKQIEGQELLRIFRQKLSEEERQLTDLRAQGHTWAEVAERLGGTPQARRKQHERAVERAVQQLELEEVLHA